MRLLPFRRCSLHVHFSKLNHERNTFFFQSQLIGHIFFSDLIWRKVLWLNDWNKQICSKSGLVLAGPLLPLMAPCVAGAGFQFCHFASVSHISALLIIACKERDKLIEEEGKKKRAESANAEVESPWLAARSHMVARPGPGSAQV